MKERFFLAFTEGQKTIFINLLQVCRAEIGIENDKPKCVLTLADRENEIFTDGPAMTLVLARLSELSVALNGQPLSPVDTTPQESENENA